MTILGFCEWLQALPWASGIKESSWQFPVIESVHSLAISFMIWPAALVDLRLLGVAMRRRPASAVTGQFLPWVWVGFTVMVLSGIPLFAAEAVKCYKSPFFPIKLALIAVAGLNALIFEKSVAGGMTAWDESAQIPWRAKLAGGVSLVVWIGVVAMGRGLAYA